MAKPIEDRKSFVSTFSQGGSEMLSSKIAQSIVDRTMAILEVQVNIMDAKAVVIASGNPERVGRFHAGAAKVLKTGKKLSICYSEAQRMEGVRPGITLPIEFKGKIIGAVGMAGNPEDVEDFGELLKLTAELMLEQASIKEEIYLEKRAREGLLNDLITGHWREYEWHFLHRAELLSYNLNQTYLVMTVELFEEGDGSSWKKQDRGLPYQKRKAQLEDRISGAGLFGGKMICCFIDGEMALLYQMPAKFDRPEELIARVAQTVKEMIRQEGGASGVIGVGGLARDWKDISGVYVDAKSALLFNKIYKRDRSICYYEHYRTEHMLSGVPETARREYWQKMLGPVLARDRDHGVQWLSTMQAYFDNDMNTVQTAEQLFLHRNTLMFRLNKIREITGLAPQKFQDAVQLKLAILLMKMDEEGGPRGKEGKNEAISGFEKRYGDGSR